MIQTAQDALLQYFVQPIRSIDADSILTHLLVKHQYAVLIAPYAPTISYAMTTHFVIFYQTQKYADRITHVPPNALSVNLKTNVSMEREEAHQNLYANGMVLIV